MSEFKSDICECDKARYWKHAAFKASNALTEEHARLIDTFAQRDYFEVALDRMTTELREAQKRCERLEADARRYAFFRANYQWRRHRDERELEEPYAFIGLKFAYEHDFSCAAMLDYHIDAALTPEPDEQAMQHQANEWADAATNGLQWLRNIKAGVSGVDEAIAAVESDIAHCRTVAQAMQEGKL